MHKTSGSGLVYGREYNIGKTNMKYVGTRKDKIGTWNVYVSGGPYYHTSRFDEGVDMRSTVCTSSVRDPEYVKRDYGINSEYNYETDIKHDHRTGTKYKTHSGFNHKSCLLY